MGLAVAGAGLVVAAVQGSSAPSASGAVTTSAFTTPAGAPTAAPSPSPVAVHVTAHPLVRIVPHKPAVRRSPAHRAATRRPAATPTPRRRVVRHRAVSFTAALMNQVARIPTYHAGQVRWVVSRAYDFWGTADWYHDVLYVSPDVPRNRLYDVAVHEWSHELSVLDYGGDVDAATSAMNAWFGGSGLIGAERAADCMAILQGATWTHYTTCTNSKWRQGAQLLVSGHPLS
jgi:hypothetical protein